MRTEKRKIGDIGEAVAVRFLVKRGFKVVGRNYLKPWGEIDIVAKSKKRKGIFSFPQTTLHFVEVKTVKRDLGPDNLYAGGGYRPEDNIHPDKIRRLKRAIQTYISERNIRIVEPGNISKARPDEVHLQVDVVTVLLDTFADKAKVEIIENIIDETSFN